MYPEIIPRLKAAYLFTANELHFDSYQFGKDVLQEIPFRGVRSAYLVLQRKMLLPQNYFP